MISPDADASRWGLLRFQRGLRSVSCKVSSRDFHAFLASCSVLEMAAAPSLGTYISGV